MTDTSSNGGVVDSTAPASDPTPDPPSTPDARNGDLANVAVTTPARNPVSRQATGISLPKKKSGLFGASSNLVNSIVGAGIIGIPFALSQAGLIAGLFLLALVAYLTDKSLRMIVELATFHPKLRGRGIHTFEDLAALAFGRIGSGFILLNMFILAYGAMVAYLLIIKDTVPTILGFGDNGFERELVLLVTSLLIVVPLSVQRDMASLAFTSLLSVTADTILVGFVAAYAPVKESVSDAGGFGEVLKNSWIKSTLFIGLGILSTAMACQHSAFIVSGSLFHKTQKRWATVTCWSILIATILCAILGITGYLGFLDDTQGDVLNNFDPDSVAANAARALLAITMFFTYPMESFVARHVLIKLLHNGDMDGEAEMAEPPTRNWCDFLNRRVKWTLAIYVMALIPALIVDDLGPVLSITGALGGSCIAYIAPGLTYLGINGEDFLAYTAGILDNYRHKGGAKDGATGDIELPVAGDSTQVMPDRTPPPAPESGSKPWWWYPLLFPVWIGVASTGSVTMRENLGSLDADWGEMPPSPTSDGDGEEEEGVAVDEVHATRRDYYISMFFVVFGVVAVIAGLASNIYVQVNNIFYTPT